MFQGGSSPNDLRNLGAKEAKDLYIKLGRLPIQVNELFTINIFECFHLFDAMIEFSFRPGCTKARNRHISFKSSKVE